MAKIEDIITPRIEPKMSEMTLRDWFAGQAMAQMVPHVVFPQSVEDQLHAAGIKTDDFEEYTAHVAYGFANAMLAQRNK